MEYFDEAKIKEIKAGMWSIVVAKVEEEAMDKATTVEEENEGDGLMAWYKLHKWYTKLSGEGLTETRKCVVSQIKHSVITTPETSLKAWEEPLASLQIKK